MRTTRDRAPSAPRRLGQRRLAAGCRPSGNRHAAGLPMRAAAAMRRWGCSARRSRRRSPRSDDRAQAVPAAPRDGAQTSTTPSDADDPCRTEDPARRREHGGRSGIRRRTALRTCRAPRRVELPPTSLTPSFMRSQRSCEPQSAPETSQGPLSAEATRGLTDPDSNAFRDPS